MTLKTCAMLYRMDSYWAAWIIALIIERTYLRKSTWGKFDRTCTQRPHSATASWGRPGVRWRRKNFRGHEDGSECHLCVMMELCGVIYVPVILVQYYLPQLPYLVAPFLHPPASYYASFCLLLCRQEIWWIGWASHSDVFTLVII